MGIPVDRGRPIYAKKEARSILLPQPPLLAHDMVDAFTSRTMPSRAIRTPRMSEESGSPPLLDSESTMSTEGGFLNLANMHHEALTYSREDQILFHQFFETVFQGRDPPGHGFGQRDMDANINVGSRRVRHLPSSRSSTRWQSAIFSSNEAPSMHHASSFSQSGPSGSNREHSVWRIAPLRRPSSPPFSSYEDHVAPFTDLGPPLLVSSSSPPPSSAPILEELNVEGYSASSHSSSLEAPFILQSSFIDR